MRGNKKRVYGLADFFGGYMDNFGQVTLANLIFSIPALIITAAFVLINIFVSQSVFLLLLTIPLLSPFTAGLFYVARRVTLGKEVRALRDFLHGIKTEWKHFLINGIVSYLIISGILVAMSLYRGGLSNPIFLMSFIFSAIFVVFYISFENSLLTMFVTVDLRPSVAVKNSVLLFIGGFLGHLKVILSYVLIGILVLSVFMIVGSVPVALITLAIPFILMLPVLCAYIVVYNTYQTIEKRVVVSFKKEQENTSKTSQAMTHEDKLDRDELVRLSKGNPDEYVFVGGRMLKRQAIQKMLEKEE